jgi:hypothetical protein
MGHPDIIEYLLEGEAIPISHNNKSGIKKKIK